MHILRILVAEDDKNLAFILQDNLALQGYEVTVCETGLQVLKCFRKGDFDLCILDVMLPGVDGFALAEIIRSQDDTIQIFFLTSRAQKEDAIQGLQLGADDYITKPFSMEELQLRIKLAVKRLLPTKTSHIPVKIGKLTFDYQNLELHHGNGKYQLTQKEGDILLLFCRHRDVILKREFILTSIWGDDDYFMGRSLDVFISKIRKYLKCDPDLEIVNVHGIGFKLKVPNYPPGTE